MWSTLYAPGLRPRTRLFMLALPWRGCRPPDPSRENQYQTLRFLRHGFWAGRQSSMFGVWVAPAASKTIPEAGGRSPPPFGMVFGAAGAAQTPKIDDFRPALKPYIRNPSDYRPKASYELAPCSQTDHHVGATVGHFRKQLRARRVSRNWGSTDVGAPVGYQLANHRPRVLSLYQGGSLTRHDLRLNKGDIQWPQTL